VDKSRRLVHSPASAISLGASRQFLIIDRALLTLQQQQQQQATLPAGSMIIDTADESTLRLNGSFQPVDGCSVQIKIC